MPETSQTNLDSKTTMHTCPDLVKLRVPQDARSRVLVGVACTKRELPHLEVRAGALTIASQQLHTLQAVAGGPLGSVQDQRGSSLAQCLPTRALCSSNQQSWVKRMR
jgi:hypothetical protein